MKRFSMYLTPGHSSITIQNGATRETSASTLTAVLAAMPEDDRRTTLLVCNAIVQAIAQDDTQALASLQM